jgi:2-polyprenyl-6-methoxyphenol hydroxylase-like FAD-dependent oxidoreductase
MDDIIVVGGRCAGAPAAMLLAKAGFKVRIIERSKKLSDTLSAHMIQVSGVARLQAWGLLDAVLATGAPSIPDFKIWVEGELTSTPGGDKPAVPEATPEASVFAPRRSALDPVLLEAARQSGVIVETGNSVRALPTNGARVTGVSTDRGDYRARLVVGADGRNSRVAKLVRAPKYIDMTPTDYAYYTYWKGCVVPEVHAFFGGGYLIAVYPTNDELTTVYLQASRRRFKTVRRYPMTHYLNVLRSQPAVMELLAGGTPAEPLRGTGDLPTFFRVSAGPGWVLVGDAGHHKDPLMARGITDAFRDAGLIADAVTSGWDDDLDQATAAYPVLRDQCAEPLSAANHSIASGLASVPSALLAKGYAWLGELEETLDPARIPPATPKPIAT